ncbi:hypothetical protein [Burkholderia gladioli]|uniref:hypothetical protein n=5 Tax=Burkholderia gladioli TaxID=28095 RepID=UPI000F54178F|nr:hypothetical protein [Burkholderia gladioli]MBJ9663489.1 hypothetical protein [Burkholderia gladioli]MCH7269634.1 hypothetical protein [Burkholderia gladioli]MDR8087691.1 hypothetical protein [Burkholderia gladioli]MDZ4036939.1 hypothetical protein [Burkholderia gladioli pv. alliicola]
MMGNRERDAKVCKQLSFLGDELPVFLASWEGSAVIFLSIFMALFLPADVLSRGGPLSDFVGWMSRFFPLIEGYGRLSKYPEVTKAYFSIMLVVSPILIRHFVRERNRYQRVRVELRITNPKKFVATGIFVALLYVLILYMWIFKNNGFCYVLMPIGSGRIELAVFGLMYAGLVIWVASSFLVSNIFIFFENKRQVIRD